MGNNGKENGNYYSILGFVWGIMEKKMETTLVYWGFYLFGEMTASDSASRNFFFASPDDFCR